MILPPLLALAALIAAVLVAAVRRLGGAAGPRPGRVDPAYVDHPELHGPARRDQPRTAVTGSPCSRW